PSDPYIVTASTTPADDLIVIVSPSLFNPSGPKTTSAFPGAIDVPAANVRRTPVASAIVAPPRSNAAPPTFTISTNSSDVVDAVPSRFASYPAGGSARISLITS